MASPKKHQSNARAIGADPEGLVTWLMAVVYSFFVEYNVTNLTSADKADKEEKTHTRSDTWKSHGPTDHRRPQS